MVFNTELKYIKSLLRMLLQTLFFSLQIIKLQNRTNLIIHLSYKF